jgi:Leucine-rich repeat (LRR) protein
VLCFLLAFEGSDGFSYDDDYVDFYVPETECDSIKTEVWFGLGQQKICKMNSAAIHSSDTTLSVMIDVTILKLNGNKEIHYLPIKLYESVPNLLLIDAGSCGVKAISKENFEKLNKLQQLWLYYNEITTIPAGTFSDLVSLNKISLGL